MKKINFGKYVYLYILLSFIFSLFFIIIRIHFAPAEILPGIVMQNIKSDYYLMLLQCLLGLSIFFLPSIIEKKFNIKIPNKLNLVYVIFLYCAIVLGEVRNFYFQFEHWDSVLHVFSGGMLGSIGLSIVSLLNDSDKTEIHLTNKFVCIFAFCFAVTLGVFWEFYEFSIDYLLGMNMQKFMLEDGTLLVGQAALMDTMKDLFIDTVGAFVVTFSAFFIMKYDEYWLSSKQLLKKEL
ncbi:MAG: hypothetical protein GX675_05985 [Erysipelotrichaceae bacterium]|nr:hypothetical protein [Erysipelotrichaceae bacterium]